MSGLMFPKKPGKKRRKHHPKSIMQERDGTCYLCAALHGDFRYHKTLHEHHVFEGIANRRLSEEYGIKVYLCLEHHMTGPEAVHKNQKVMDFLHQQGQEAFEQDHSREEFVRIFGANYL